MALWCPNLCIMFTKILNTPISIVFINFTPIRRKLCSCFKSYYKTGILGTDDCNLHLFSCFYSLWFLIYCYFSLNYMLNSSVSISLILVCLRLLTDHQHTWGTALIKVIQSAGAAYLCSTESASSFMYATKVLNCMTARVGIIFIR